MAERQETPFRMSTHVLKPCQPHDLGEQKRMARNGGITGWLRMAGGWLAIRSLSHAAEPELAFVITQ